ncbi:MAG: DUF4249 domain-containing protein [Saprospiraceae bacterium]|nr:DUF4249 domain-containing protein [Saprospiraceae bacterium]
MNRVSSIILLLTTLYIFGCNLEQEIKIELPDYEGRPAVECYLEPGQPFTLLLTKSASYFDPFPSFNTNDFLDAILENDAEVIITHNGTSYKLKNTLVFNPFTGKVFNYYAPDLVPKDYEHDFELKIVTPAGKTIEARTRILPTISIDSVVAEFPEKSSKLIDTLARVLTYLSDPPGQTNFFRRVVNDERLESIPDQDFVTDDTFINNNKLIFGTGYDYAKGDTVFNTIYHIEKAYFEFLESLFRARTSNGNPFVQPSPIISNVKGSANAIGIFTFLSYDRKFTVIR